MEGEGQDGKENAAEAERPAHALRWGNAFPKAHLKSFILQNCRGSDPNLVMILGFSG